jgi:hypothetical protein
MLSGLEARDEFGAAMIAKLSQLTTGISLLL